MVKGARADITHGVAFKNLIILLFLLLLLLLLSFLFRLSLSPLPAACAGLSSPLAGRLLCI